jgi:hypothetical protein
LVKLKHDSDEMTGPREPGKMAKRVRVLFNASAHFADGAYIGRYMGQNTLG